MAIKLHPSIDQGVKAGNRKFKGGTLTCPKHEWTFDIASGRCTAKGDRPLNVLPHKIEAKRLLAYW